MTFNKDKAQGTGIYDFNIADFIIRVVFDESTADDINLLTSFHKFKAKVFEENTRLFKLTVEDNLQCKSKTEDNIGTFDTGNGDTIVERLDDGGYKFIIKNINGDVCCTLLSDECFSNCRCSLNGNRNMRHFGLNNSLMLIFAFAGSRHQTLLMHASLVRNNGYGYAFIAKSGTGKSTHTGLWLKHIPGCELMNDDNPIIRIIDDVPYIYGSPWSGKTPCYRQIKARLGAITRIDRASENSIEKLKPVQAFASLLPSCSSMKWDKNIHDATCRSITKIIETTGIYTLHCLPDKDAALLCHKEISR